MAKRVMLYTDTTWIEKARRIEGCHQCHYRRQLPGYQAWFCDKVLGSVRFADKCPEALPDWCPLPEWEENDEDYDADDMFWHPGENPLLAAARFLHEAGDE